MATRITIQPASGIIAGRDGARCGIVIIAYEKAPSEELWLRGHGGRWERPNLFRLVGRADADERGHLDLDILPGETIEAGIFARGSGPTSAMPTPLRTAIATTTGLDQEPDSNVPGNATATG